MSKMIKVLSVAGVLTAAFLCQPAQARERSSWGGPRYEHPHARPYSYTDLRFKIPHGSISIGFGKERYWYHGGNFYRPFNRQYLVVPPPVGVVVYQTPADFHQVIIDGATYYTYNGVYYKRVAPQGYQVVQPPVPLIVEPVVTVNAAPDEEETFSVNIPLKKGGYKAVIIKRDGEGFKGPQGEFYPEFPRVEQLKLMYVDRGSLS